MNNSNNEDKKKQIYKSYQSETRSKDFFKKDKLEQLKLIFEDKKKQWKLLDKQNKTKKGGEKNNKKLIDKFLKYIKYKDRDYHLYTDEYSLREQITNQHIINFSLSLPKNKTISKKLMNVYLNKYIDKVNEIEYEKQLNKLIQKENKSNIKDNQSPYLNNDLDIYTQPEELNFSNINKYNKVISKCSNSTNENRCNTVNNNNSLNSELEDFINSYNNTEDKSNDNIHNINITNTTVNNNIVNDSTTFNTNTCDYDTRKGSTQYNTNDNINKLNSKSLYDFENSEVFKFLRANRHKKIIHYKK